MSLGSPMISILFTSTPFLTVSIHGSRKVVCWQQITSKSSDNSQDVSYDNIFQYQPLVFN